jgi:mannose-6-phosphate isomerase-like protein (cupin superfamily)
VKRWRLADLEHERETGARPYIELLRAEPMSAGVYVLPAGGVDEQQPHTEDEVYVVMRGSARFTAGGETVDVTRGDTLFVPAMEPHRFHDIAEELVLLVVFAPPEGTAGRID